MSYHDIMILIILTFAQITPIILGASIDSSLSKHLSSNSGTEQHGGVSNGNNQCDIRKCFFEHVSFDSMSCHQFRQINSCLRRLTCRGNLEYHTALTLTNQKKRCVNNDVRSNVRSGDTKNTHQAIQYRLSNSYRRPPYEHLTGFPLQYCLSAAMNYTISSPVSSMQQFMAHQQTIAIPTNRIANSEELHRQGQGSHGKSRTERVRRSDNLLQASKDALQFVRSHQARSTESQTRNEDSMQPDQHLMSDLMYVSNPLPTPMLACMIFGDPHLRTFDTRYQTCNSLGTRPLIEHPLFYVQITNSRLKEQFNATGVTKVTVLVRGFGPCHINSNLIYESDSIAQVEPSTTFTDGSVNNFANMVYIKSSSKGQMVTIHLVHIGARVYISQFKGTHFLNIVVKFRSDMAYNPMAIFDAISPMSLCKSGCHPKEVVDLKKVLTDAGVDVDGQKEEEDSEEDVNSSETVVNIDDEQEDDDDDDDDETRVKQTVRKQESSDYVDYEDYEDEISARKPPKRRLKRDESSTNKPKQRKNNRKNNRKNKNKNRKQNRKPAGIEDAFRMLRSSSSSQHSQYSDPSEFVRSGETNLQLQETQNEFVSELPKTPYEKCEDLRKYFRLTCLYDVAIKGISNIDPHLFAVSFDEVRLEGNFTYIFDKNHYSTSSSVTRLPVTSLSFALIVFAMFYYNF